MSLSGEVIRFHILYNIYNDRYIFHVTTGCWPEGADVSIFKMCNHEKIFGIILLFTFQSVQIFQLKFFNSVKLTFFKNMYIVLDCQIKDKLLNASIWILWVFCFCFVFFFGEHKFILKRCLCEVPRCSPLINRKFNLLIVIFFNFRLLNSFAEEQAIEDAIYYLGEGLRRNVIDLDVFLKVM